MSGRSWEDTPFPIRGFRPGLDSQEGTGTRGFESLQLCIDEDTICARLMRRHARRMPDPGKRMRVLRLARKLTQGIDEPHSPPETLASRVYARGVRYRLAGNLWRLAAEPTSQPIAFVTLIRIGMWVPAADLAATNPRKLNKRLINDLNRSGVTAAGGWLMGTLDAEFDSRRNGYEFHWHLIVSGEKLGTLEELRQLGFYVPERVGEHDVGKPDPIRVQVKRTIKRLANASAYALKFRVRDEQTFVVDGKVEPGTPRRLPTPHLAEWLLWMDQWSVSDLLITQGLERTAKRIAVKTPLNT